MTVIAVIGAGSWGTAFSDLLGRAGQDVRLWGRDPDLIRVIASEQRNPRYLTELELSPRVEAVSDLEEAVSGAAIVALAVPSPAMRPTMDALVDYLADAACLVSLAKGLEPRTLLRMTEVMSAVASGKDVAALSGPNHAEEIGCGIPSATVIACSNETTARFLQTEFMTPGFRVYRNLDIVGVELAGASKNVIALAAGIADGLGFGDNAKASLVTRGLAEMTRLGVAMGADRRTFAGLAGMGDLVATCTSRHSRNRAVGERLAQGESAVRAQEELGMVAEGVKTAETLRDLAALQHVDMPLAASVYDIIYRGKDPRTCVEDLMSRGPAEES